MHPGPRAAPPRTFLFYLCARAAAMAAVAPDHDVDLAVDAGDGSDALVNINAAGPGCSLKLHAAHWLREASGGCDAALWSHLDSMLKSALYFEADTLDTVLVIDTALSLPTIAGVCRAALNAGMERSSKGSMTSALHYLADFVRSQRASTPAPYTVKDAGQFAAVDATQPRSLGDAAWVFKLTVSMCVDADGDGVVLAALSEIFSGRFNATNRNEEDFKSCASELFQITKEDHSSLGSLSDYRKAMAVAATIGALAPEARLIVPLPVKKALNIAIAYRHKPEKALMLRFLQAWTLAFPHLCQLLTQKCSSREAWAHAARLLGHEPTYVSLRATDARIPKLMSAVEADAALAGPAAPIEARVAEMERLLHATSATRGSTAFTGSGEGAASSDDTLNLTKALADPAAKTLLGALEPLHTYPLESYKVVRTLLQSDSPIGLKFLQGFKVNNPLFKAFTSCIAPVAVVTAFKRQLAVDKDMVVRAEMYEFFDTDKGTCTLPLKLIAGTFASDKGLNFNPWLDAAGPRFRVLMGGHASHPQQDAAAMANPAAFFSDEFMLRHGAAPLVDAFSFIGLPKKGPDSLAATLESMLQITFRITLLPDHLQNSKNGSMDLTGAKHAALRGLQRAAVRGLADFAAEVTAVSKTPIHEAKKPLVFAPKDCAMRVELKTVEETLAPLDVEVKLDTALRRGVQHPISPMPLASATDVAVMEATFTDLTSTASKEATLAAKSAIDAASAWGSSSNSPGPSISQVNAPPYAPPPHMGFPFNPYQPLPPPPMAPPPFPYPPYAASSVPPSFSAASVPPAQQPALPPTGIKGSLAYTLTPQGGGVWATTPQGLRWCGAKSPTHKPFDLSKACLASVLPNGMNPDLYCSRGGDCKHVLPAGFTKLAKPVIPMAHDLITVKEEPGTSGRGKSKGRGRGRGRGGKGRGVKKE